MQAIRLKAEHLFDPVGVDFVIPRLYWNCSGGRKQAAYQIVAADDIGSTLWDSGKVESAAIAVYSDMERTGFLKAPTHFSISLLKTPSGVPRTTTPTCPQIARPANATAGRATRRFSSTLRHIFLTMRLLHRNICGMCTTGRKKTGSCRKSPPTAVWISICPLWTEASAGRMRAC
mgnify:CR=1 FL=1